MTEAQAHQFVARWQFLLVPRKVRTEAEVIHDLHKDSAGTLILLMLMMVGPSQRIGSSNLWLAVFATIVFLILFTIWLGSRLHQARRALNQSQIANPKS